jgi:hypothetical protein
VRGGGVRLGGMGPAVSGAAVEYVGASNESQHFRYEFFS